MLYLFVYIAITFVFFQSVSQGRNQRNERQLAFFLMVMALIVGLGDMLGGYDRYVYCDLFDGTADDVMAGRNPFSKDAFIMGYSSEMSYVVLNVIIAHVTANRYIFILLLTIFVYVMLYLSMKDYLENYPFGLLMFSALYFFFTFTYLRQVCATCFAWFSFRYVLKRKLLPYLICWFIAYKFHNSAIIFLPMYFIPLKKYPKKIIIYVMIALLLIGSTGISASLYSMYGEASGTAQRTEQYEVYGHSFRLDYVIEAVVFLYLILSRYREIPEDTKHIVFLNASLCFCAILLFFVTNSSAGRQSWYYMIGIIYTISYIVTRKKGINNYVLYVYALMTLLFLRIDYYWDYLINPYKTFLTDGHRQNDRTFYGYEYDQQYDKDKFYRPVLYLK